VREERRGAVVREECEAAAGERFSRRKAALNGLSCLRRRASQHESGFETVSNQPVESMACSTRDTYFQKNKGIF